MTCSYEDIKVKFEALGDNLWSSKRNSGDSLRGLEAKQKFQSCNEVEDQDELDEEGKEDAGGVKKGRRK